MDGIRVRLRLRRTGIILSLSVLAVIAGAATTAVAQPLSQDTAPLIGTVVDPDGRPVAGARVTLGDTGGVAITDAGGRFELAARSGATTLRIRHPAFAPLELSLAPEAARDSLELTLAWPVSLAESITVMGIRADEETPVTRAELSHERIQTLSFGQDVPALLEVTPSVTSYSDSGSGSNYSYFTIRGIQQTRINITLDGAPLNDPAEHALYFNNFHDLTSAVDSIQVQRGVGISTVGAPAYGGSVNFVSPAPAERAGGDARLVLGSFDTRRASIGLHSGPLGGGFSLGGRFSYSSTDGYRDHSGSEHHTLFVHGGWQDERSSLRLTGFLAEERSDMAFLAVEPEVLADDPRFNPLDEAERDEFGQDFAQLKYTRSTGERGLWTASLYYNRADGFFLLWDDPVAQTALLDFGVDQSFWGSMLTYSTGGERLWTSFGVHYNDFSGDHTLDVGGARAYSNTGFKNTANAFAKAELRLGGTLLFGDLGFRWARFAYEGDLDLGAVDWTFVDPRVGVRHWLSDRLSLYASVGRAQREPARLDLLAGEDNASVRHDLEAVRPESVVDVEAGVGFRTETLAVQANVYAMEFTDEIALTGELSDVGLPIRRNVDRSYRRGIELDLRWRPTGEWSVFHTVNLSRNRIRSWTQYTDVYDADFSYLGSEPLTYRDVPPLLTPERIANLGVEWSQGDLVLGGTLRHVAASHLDNTGLDRFTIPEYTRVDLRGVVELGRPRLRLFANNVLDAEDHYGSGYSYQFLVQDGSGATALDGIRYFYPLADRSLMAILEVDF